MPTDFSELSRNSLILAFDIAKKYNSKVILLHVFDENLISPIYMRSNISVDSYFKELQENFDSTIEKFLENINTDGIDMEWDLVSGTPFVEIVKFAADNGIDLIVMSSHGRTGVAHAFLGSVTEKVVRKAHCPVLVIKNPKFRFEKIT